MNVKVEQLEKNVVQLEIEVDAAKFEEGMQKAYIKNVKKFNIPGFRKGKAPRKIVERYYGEAIFYEDAINIVCPEAYDEAVEQTKIEPVDRPEIDIKQIGNGQNLIFTAKVTVKPEIVLGDYKGIEVNKIEYNVTEDDVAQELKKMQEKNSRLITVEDRPVQMGDIAVIDFEGFVDGEAFDGGKGTNYNLEIGSGQFIPGFEEQLIGKNTGEEVEVNVTFPEEYHVEALAGKPAVFKVKINQIKYKELPVIDDEFAKDVSEFDTLEELKEDIRKKLTQDAEHRAKHELENAVIDKVVENVTVEIPEVMIEHQIDYITRDFDLRLRAQGLTLDKYLELIGSDIPKFREQFKEQATKQVKTSLVLEKIGKEEEIDVTDEEVDKEIVRLAENYKMEIEKLKNVLRPEDIQSIKDELILGKTVDMLVQNAKIA
ncbi:MAG: trigger factor [Petroclostridium sp.]|jgi:trigger factor|uniref:trigger factor n=1 Tax=Petroclostridium xylanilyticum TaxID=1792311 RepID=UPI000B97CB35|nr:trigger factor [Petroclostridium xylanilyticum]MBZ4646398.1 trigger factor [Clostridia bacterium]MDK2809649.1 trigger factor [Petroclostridium sp.]